MAAGKPAFAHTEWAGASMAVDPPSQPQTDQRSDCENDKRRSRPVDNWARQVMPHLVRPRISRIGQVTGKCDERLDSIVNAIDRAGTKVEAAAKAPPAPAAAPPRSGPDPNKVYAIKTDRAPAKGPANAPVTIAEFSDFQ